MSTTAQLIALAQEAADLTNVADYVTTATWTSWLNAGIQELHRLVTNKFKATFYRTFDFTLTSESLVALPSNFWKLTGLDIDAGTPRRRPVRPFNFAERNSFRQNSFRSLIPYATDRSYALVGSAFLKIEAEEQAAGAYRLYYTPKPRLLGVAVPVPIATGDNVDNAALWTLANFVSFIPLIGDGLQAMNSAEGDNAGARLITSVPSSTSVVTDGISSSENFAVDTVINLSANSLDPELEPFSEYVWLTAAIKSLVKEESFAQAKELKDQRNLIRNDLAEALETDSGGPATVIDTDDDGAW